MVKNPRTEHIHEENYYRFGFLAILMITIAGESVRRVIQLEIPEVEQSMLVSGGTFLFFFRCGALAIILWIILRMAADPVGIECHNSAGTRSVLLVGFGRFTTFTVWSWCLQCVYYSLLILSYFVEFPSFLSKLTLIFYEISLPMSVLVTVLVTVVLCPLARMNGRDAVFWSLNALMMHNANIFFMMVELFYNGLPFYEQHFPVLIIWGCSYVFFAWIIYFFWHGIFYYIFLEYKFWFSFLMYLGVILILFGFYQTCYHISFSLGK